MVPASPRMDLPPREIEEGRPGRKVCARGGRAKALLQFSNLIAGILLFAFTLPCRAQSAPGPQPKSGNEKPRNGPVSTDATRETIHVSSPLVVVPFTVTAPSGDFVYDLDESNVRVFDNGVQQRIRHFGMTTQPTSAVIVVQANRKA